MELQSIEINNTGFPSPASDYEERRLSADKLIKSDNPNTFFMELEEDYAPLFLLKNDILVVDKGESLRINSLVVTSESEAFCLAQVTNLKPIKLSFLNKKNSAVAKSKVWGVVRSVIRKI